MSAFYGERYWQVDTAPNTNQGVTHAVALDIDLDPVAVCGRVCDTYCDFKVPSTQLVTCVFCWARALKQPHVRW